MATENKAIAVYLPDDLLERVTKFCLENGLTRKGKGTEVMQPSLGTGILKMLERMGDDIPPLPSKTAPPSNLATQDDLTALESRLLAEVEKKLQPLS
jgi:PhoPQ-activated pathogenicity-related protein